MNDFPCSCEKPGFCPIFDKVMGERAHAICSGSALTPDKREVYVQNWLKMANKPVHPSFCLHRGEVLETKTCHTCGNRGNKTTVHSCTLFGKCTLKQYQVGQSEKVCDYCESKVGIVKPKWDKQVENLIPSKTNQNFNCSLITWRGRKLFAYRHDWENSTICLAELDEEFVPKWNTRLRFPRHYRNIAQEDPRLFVYKDELHVAYTAVEYKTELIANVGYAKLKEEAPGSWIVENDYLPEFPKRNKWEKNWGFFESLGKLWAVYDAEHHTILSIDGNRADLAYHYDGPTIPPNGYGSARGGASPQFWRGKFYSFIHFRKAPKGYALGCYTFESQPPFNPISYLPYPLLTPNKEQCTNEHASEVVYPCGASLINWRWVISYGAYDRDSRVTSFDVNELETGLVKYGKPLNQRLTTHSISGQLPTPSENTKLLRLLDTKLVATDV